MNPKDFYNSVAPVYNLRHDSPATILLRKKERSLVRKFSRGTILDFGCGTGFHLKNNSIGIDISEKMLERAKTKSKFLIKSNENMPIKSHSVDTIFCFFTVLNMVDTEKIKTEFFRILRPNGRILLSAASIFDNEGKKEKTLKVYHSKVRLRLFEKKEIQKTFSNFQLEYFDSLFALVKPQWGNFRDFSIKEKIHLFFERFPAKEKGKIYFMVFRKI